jgi:hypothetical protein
VLRDSSDPASADWPLRGEILGHLDRLTSELQAEQLSRSRDQGGPGWRDALLAALPMACWGGD